MNHLILLTQSSGSSMLMLLVPVLFLAVMYFTMIRPQKKQEKKLQELRNNLQIGDQIISIGGIVGKVVNIKDGEVTIVTSVAGTMMTFRKEAINQVIKNQPETEATTNK